jgi:hypothetical protein
MKWSTIRIFAPGVVAAATCLVAAAACGSAAAPRPTSAAAPKVSLSITVSAAPGSQAQHWTLTCDPAGGTHPDPAAACAELLRTGDPAVAPQPKSLSCPMILASAKTASITGTYYGHPVNTTIREGGCGPTLWTRLGQVVN